MVRQRSKRPSAIGKIVNELAPVYLPNRTPLEALTRKFSAKKRNDGTDAALSRVAKDFLEWVPNRWDTKLGEAFWPSSVAGQMYEYENDVDRGDIVNGIKRIMARQQERRRASLQQRRLPAEEESDIEHDDPLMAPSQATNEPIRLSASRRQGK